MSSNICFICDEKYNNSIHKLISCEYGDCNFESCKTCVRTYLLTTANDPHCMECKKLWTEQFIVEQLNRSFITNDYKTHRRTLLLDREISKLPETMASAEKFQQVETQKIVVSQVKDKIREARNVVDDLFQSLEVETRRLNLIKNGKSETDVEKRKFIMACPNNDCRGYLSSQYKCGMCNLHTCSDCHDVIGYRKDDPHTCKEENIKSAEMIKKETKPCPTCGTRISKISGCDQMWCPECHKAFSWRTGLIDKGIVHNPHFYQYQRENAGGADPPRNPGDAPCGGIIEWYTLNNQIFRKIKSGTLLPETEIELRTRLGDVHRFVAHITRVDLENTRTKIRELSDLEEMRCKYILKRISKEELAKNIYRNDASRKKLTEMLNLYELLSVVGIELFAKLINNKDKDQAFLDVVLTSHGEYNKLREYCNKQFKTISITYNQTVPYINKSYTIVTKKYKITTNKVAKRVKPNDVTSLSTDKNITTNDINTESKGENVILE